MGRHLPGCFVLLCSVAFGIPRAHAGFVYSLYDDFNDNSIDSSKWNVSGSPMSAGPVEETDGLMYIYMHRNGAFFEGGTTSPGNRAEVSTEGKTGGYGILGFRLNSDRVPAVRTGPGDAEAAVGIRDASNNFLDINWLHDVNEFVVRANGYYGTGDLFRWDPDEPGPATQPDGPLEIRDNGDNSISVLHNNSVVYTLAGKSILNDTFFHGYGFSRSSGGENGVPVDFDYAITIDDVEFLHQEVPEPSSFLLLAMGCVLVACRQRLTCARSRVGK